jgi:hypothetical protein
LSGGIEEVVEGLILLLRGGRFSGVTDVQRRSEVRQGRARVQEIRGKIGPGDRGEVGEVRCMAPRLGQARMGTAIPCHTHTLVMSARNGPSWKSVGMTALSVGAVLPHVGVHPLISLNAGSRIRWDCPEGSGIDMRMPNLISIWSHHQHQNISDLRRQL